MLPASPSIRTVVDIHPSADDRQWSALCRWLNHAHTGAETVAVDAVVDPRLERATWSAAQPHRVAVVLTFGEDGVAVPSLEGVAKPIVGDDFRRVIMFTEGDFERIADFGTLREARAFADGFTVGAGCYGGSGQAYVMPEDEAQMHEDQSASAIHAAFMVMPTSMPAPPPSSP